MESLRSYPILAHTLCNPGLLLACSVSAVGVKVAVYKWTPGPLGVTGWDSREQLAGGLNWLVSQMIL